ncbi:uncharacterized protein LOC128453586 [Pleuronectes platessa]|uniref:uncharacterized protein LOC128453586 n=1 Tax=Pleuronectes platessa TaxID=8262 RepID=UPI00232A2DA0|nr:uncharacterized protein LOC128453586 [Pleuronectes platessa]
MRHFGLNTEPLVSCDIDGVPHLMLADTGATYSCLRTTQPLSENSTMVVGVTGSPIRQSFTQPLRVTLGSHTVSHAFLSAPTCPANLLGRDLMCKLKLKIYLDEKGVQISSEVPETTRQHPIRILFTGETPQPQDQEVFWLRLMPTGPSTPHIQFLFNTYKPKMYALHPYTTPLSHIHCTLNVTSNPDEQYEEDWDENMAHLQPKITCSSIVCGKEGVAAEVKLDDFAEEWYQLTESAPHVTLTVGFGYEARSLGPMMKRAQGLTWIATTDPEVLKAATEDMWKFNIPATTETTLPEHLPIPRHHGLSCTGHTRLHQAISS